MASSLHDSLSRVIATGKGTQVGLAARRLRSGSEILINPDLQFHAASTFKICVMMEVFSQARAGTLSLGEPLPVVNRFASIADGAAFSLSPEDDSERALYGCIGTSLPIRELVRRMMAVSSNLATNLLVQRITAEHTTEFMRQLGATGLRILRGVEDKRAYALGLNNLATARGFEQVLVKLANREILSPTDSDEMIAILCQEEFNQMIPAGVPVSVRVAHKTGWTADLFHDVGIVYPLTAEPFVLVILTRGYAETQAHEAHEFVATLARTIYENWS